MFGRAERLGYTIRPMRRKISFILIVFTLLQSAQPAFAFVPKQTTTQTCCGRTVCQCTHARGAQCPIQREKQTMRQHAQCHVKQHKEPKQVLARADKKIGITTVPCGDRPQWVILSSEEKELTDLFLSRTANFVFANTVIEPLSSKLNSPTYAIDIPPKINDSNHS